MELSDDFNRRLVPLAFRPSHFDSPKIVHRSADSCLWDRHWSLSHMHGKRKMSGTRLLKHPHLSTAIMPRVTPSNTIPYVFTTDEGDTIDLRPHLFTPDVMATALVFLGSEELVTEMINAQWEGMRNHPRLIGLKPRSNSTSTDVQVLQLFPTLNVRIWGGQLEDMSSFHFDFVHPETGHPINLPEGWKIYVMPGPTIGIPCTILPQMASTPMAEMKSMEECHGVSRSAILPGEEKYIAMEGTTFKVTSPSGESARFRLPLRVPVGWNPNQAMSFPSTGSPHSNSTASTSAA